MRPALLLSCLACCLFHTSAQAADALAALPEPDRTVVSRYIGHAVAAARDLDPAKLAAKVAENPEMLAWIEFPALDCLLDAAELTGDTAHLDLFLAAFAKVEALLEKGDDGFLGWWGKPIKPRLDPARPDLRIDELQMNFRAIGILARWVELAQRAPAYAEAHAADRARYLALMRDHLYPKWDARGFFADLGDGGGVYRGLDYPLCTATAPGATLSHEKLSLAVEGLLRLHRIAPDGPYLRRAVQIGARFKRILSLKDGHYEWMSWEPAGAWDVHPTKEDAYRIGWIAPDPKGEWYAAALSIAIRLYQHGLVFTNEDLARFIATQKTRCWNGDLEKPAYCTVAGVGPEQSKHVTGRFLSQDLAPYDAVLDRLAFAGPHEAEVLAGSENPWKGGTALTRYVRNKFILRPLLAAKPQPWAEFGTAFLADPTNRAWHDRLAAPVVAPGYVTPLKPSAMPKP